jgi:hypothetical protein
VRGWLAGRNRRPGRWLGILRVAFVHAVGELGATARLQEGPALLFRAFALVLLLGVLAGRGAENDALPELFRQSIRDVAGVGEEGFYLLRPAGWPLTRGRGLARRP